jgi:hypothetical protein
MQIDKPRNSMDQISDLRARAPTRALLGSQARFFESDHRMIPGVHVPVRSMLVENADERILVSPIGTSEESDTIGRDLTTLVSPSLLHHIHLLEAIERMEPRELWGPPGLDAKVPELGHARTFGRDAWPHRDQLDFVVVEGSTSREVAMFHIATRTLFVADLVMNIQRPHGVLTPLMFRAMGIYKKFAMPTMWRRWVTDRAKFVHSMDRILAWDFERIAMAHGAMVVADAHACFEQALHERRLYD